MSSTTDFSTLTPSQQEALKRLLALRKLSHELGIRTTRSQNLILQGLADTDLIAVANALAQIEENGGSL